MSCKQGCGNIQISVPGQQDCVHKLGSLCVCSDKEPTLRKKKHSSRLKKLDAAYYSVCRGLLLK